MNWVLGVAGQLEGSTTATGRGDRRMGVNVAPKAGDIVMELAYTSLLGTSKIEYAEPRRVRDRVGAADCVELVEQGADVELGRVNGNAESARDLFVRGSLSKQRENLKFARRQWDLTITQGRCCRGKYQGCISGFARTD